MDLSLDCNPTSALLGLNLIYAGKDICKHAQHYIWRLPVHLLQQMELFGLAVITDIHICICCFKCNILQEILHCKFVQTLPASHSQT
eukprot:7419138-Ditylum_brightwellii.AAC.1